MNAHKPCLIKKKKEFLTLSPKIIIIIFLDEQKVGFPVLDIIICIHGFQIPRDGTPI